MNEKGLKDTLYICILDMSKKYLNYNADFADTHTIDFEGITADVNNEVAEENVKLVVMGEINEGLYQDVIFEIVSPHLRRTGSSSDSKTHFETTDWETPNNSHYAELKSRSCQHNDFKGEGMIVGWNKIQTCMDSKKTKSYFFFGCMDGLFMWECNTQNYNAVIADADAKGEKAVRKQTRRDKTCYSSLNENKLHLFIKPAFLTRVKSATDNYYGKCWVHPEILEKKQQDLNNWIKEQEAKKPKKNTGLILNGTCYIRK